MTKQTEQQTQQPPPADARAAALATVLTGAATVAAQGAVVAGAAGILALTADMIRRLTRLWLSWGYRRTTIRHGLRVTTRVMVTRSRPGTPGPAAAATAAGEPNFTAWFLERSTARVEEATAAGVDPDEAMKREERYVDQHLDARKKRREAAEKVDAEAAKSGNVIDADPTGGPGRVILRWRSHTDDRVTPECVAADGAWFYADTPPKIGFPGMPHGGTCRCWPVHAGTLEEVARGRTVDEATAGLLDKGHRVYPAVQPDPGAGTGPDERTA